MLRAAGIEVAVAAGEDAAACAELIAPFLVHAVTGLPEVTLKLATSLDGKIATATGESRWISGPASRALVHRWRADADAVGVGIGTALADDPQLTARDVEGPVRQPSRVVFDSRRRCRCTPRWPTRARELPVIVLAAEDAPVTRVAALEAVGVEVVRVPRDARGADPARRCGRSASGGSSPCSSRAARAWPGRCCRRAPWTASPGSWRRS